MSFSTFFKKAGELLGTAGEKVKNADLGAKFEAAGTKLDDAKARATAAVLTEAEKGAAGDDSLKAQLALAAVDTKAAVDEGVEVAKETFGRAKDAVTGFFSGSEGPKPQA